MIVSSDMMNTVLTDPAPINLTAKAVYLRLLWHRSPDGVCKPGEQRLADDLHIGIATIQRAIRSLEEVGWLKRIRVGKTKTNNYDLHRFVTHQNDVSPHEVIDQNDVSDPSKRWVMTHQNDRTIGKKKEERKKEKETVTANAVTDETPAAPAKATPYTFMIAFYKEMGTDPPADRPTKKKVISQARLLLDRGATIPDLPSLIASCAWAKDVDMGTLLANYEKWRIGKNHHVVPERKKSNTEQVFDRLREKLNMNQGQVMNAEGRVVS